jgi:hypothetical protein
MCPWYAAVLETFGRDARKPNNLWRLIAADRKAPELAKLANRLYEIPVNAASHKRCFSHAGIPPAQMRSRCQQDKLAMMVQVNHALIALHVVGSRSLLPHALTIMNVMSQSHVFLHEFRVYRAHLPLPTTWWLMADGAGESQSRCRPFRPREGEASPQLSACA